MDDLRHGKIDEIKVGHDEFMDFQKVWVNYDQRKEIVGTARRNGTVIYHYAENGNV
ncbi:hypothetical protein IV38_GL001419 [Lactobacillus selangorensis]|uniref:Uncharacterized protein n=2 Tax=Lactobacillus selangorensis TaxID=81857 RepID=A0A0R2FII2_9LACO|nr:hypothetical protein IV38_GL001419 [Lactobacillus selangorensis]KRN31920.1 hypothetical protein IV40_GL001206 [Lactobacillus selangorensis]